MNDRDINRINTANETLQRLKRIKQYLSNYDTTTATITSDNIVIPDSLRRDMASAAERHYLQQKEWMRRVKITYPEEIE